MDTNRSVICGHAVVPKKPVGLNKSCKRHRADFGADADAALYDLFPAVLVHLFLSVDLHPWHSCRAGFTDFLHAVIMRHGQSDAHLPVGQGIGKTLA